MDLDSFGKERISKMAMEKFWIFASKSILNWMQLIVILNTVYVMFVHLTLYNTKHNPLKDIQYIVENNFFYLYGVFMVFLVFMVFRVLMVITVSMVIVVFMVFMIMVFVVLEKRGFLNDYGKVLDFCF